jgi:hypothetical protein
MCGYLGRAGIYVWFSEHGACHSPSGWATFGSPSKVVHKAGPKNKPTFWGGTLKEKSPNSRKENHEHYKKQ